MGLFVVDSLPICPICHGVGPQNQEHIFGAWLERLLVSRGYATDLYNYTLRVCRRCNARMNRHIENPVQPVAIPLFFGQGTAQLSASEQKILSRWGLKVIILSTFAGAVSGPVPEDFRVWLTRNGRPPLPEHTSVWIGRFNEFQPQPREADADLINPPLDAMAEWGGSVAFPSGLAVFVTYTPALPEGQPTHPAVARGYLVPLSRSLSRRSVVHWPPPMPMNKPILDALASYYRRPLRRPRE